MHDTLLDRRRFLAALGASGGLAFAPGALARAGDWRAVGPLFDEWIRSDRVPGLAAAIGRGTDAPDFIQRGALARASKAPVTPDSLFRVYSMTKPLTAMTAMLLVEDGKLGLDQPVAEFIPGFARMRVAADPVKSLEGRPATRPVTVRGLMTHTSGLGYDITVKGALLGEYRRLGLGSGVVSRFAVPGLPNPAYAPSLAAFAERIGTLPLIAEPGTRWSYSAGLDVLGRVIELASGKPFDAFMRERLLLPLGMTSTYWRVPRAELGRLTTNYGIANGFKLPIDVAAQSVYQDPPPYLMGGSGLVMSPRDYDRFLRVLAGYGAVGRVRVMSEATARLAMSNLLPAGVDFRGQGFGAGGRVTIKREANSPEGVGTYGWGGAAGTVAWVDPTRRVRASGFVQYMPDSAYKFREEFGRAVYAAL